MVLENFVQTYILYYHYHSPYLGPGAEDSAGV